MRNIDKNALELNFKLETGYYRESVPAKEYVEWLEEKVTEQLRIEVELENYRLNPFTVAGNLTRGMNVDLETFKKLRVHFQQTFVNIPHEIVFGNVLREREIQREKQTENIAKASWKPKITICSPCIYYDMCHAGCKDKEHCELYKEE